LKTEETITTSEEEEGRSEMKKQSVKPMDKKTGHDKGEESSYMTRSDGLRKEDTKPGTIMSKDNAKQTKHETPTNGESSLKEIQTTTAMTSVNNEDTSAATIRKDKRIKVCYKCGQRGHIAHNCKTKTNDRKRKDSKSATIPAMNRRQGNKLVKRCHFCRKRGHIKKNCPIKQKCWNWLKGGSV